MSSTWGKRAARAVTIVAAVALLGLARPAAVGAAIMIDQQSLENGGRYSWPALAQSVTAGGGGQLGVEIMLSRSTTFTANVRVEIRTLGADEEPTGYAKTSTGVLLGAATVPTAAISTDASNPSWVNVPFPADAAPLIASGQRFAIVLVRGATSGLYWHASAANSNPYAGGSGWFCVAADCWDAQSPSGTHDFVFRTSVSTPPIGPTPSAPIANLIAPFSPTNASTLAYTLKFDKPVTGLSASDFTRTGTATGCSVGAPSGAGSSYTVNVSGCSSGTVQLTLKAGSVTEGVTPGPTSAVASPTLVRIDRTKPVAYVPLTSLAKGRTLDGTRLPDKIRWAAGSDGSGTGIDRYKLQYSTDAGDTWVTVATTTALSLYSKADPAGILRYRVRAYDEAGNASAWRYGPTLRPRLAQQTSTKVTYGGTWATVKDTDLSGGSARTSTSRGAWARYTFTGRSIAIVMSRDANLGKVKIYVNGVYVTTVDTYAAAPADRVLVWQRTWSTSATRNVKVVVSGTTGRPRVILDAFARL